MDTHRSSLYFYQYLGTHSLLIGLLPFFLPVYLWTRGLPLAGLSLLIGVSGIAFAVSLRFWQRWAVIWPLRKLIALTFLLEVCLLVIVGIFTVIPGMVLFSSDLATDVAPHAQASVGLITAIIGIGCLNGIYNAFFWTSQRALFIQQLGVNDAGKQYGNFQIFVTVFLQVGILLGGFLLENGGFVALLAISAGVSAVSNLWLTNAHRAKAPLLTDHARISSRQCLSFKDLRGSRPVFAIDGIFLYLESHFWTLSLFLVVKQDFTKLGIAVVLLAAGFAAMFYVIKNRIDTTPVDMIFKGTVLLYTLSWLLRFTLTDESHGYSLLVTLLFITFFSSFFRLTFNKRFFDVARNIDTHRQDGAVSYLLIKSYNSQWILGLFYIAMGVVLFSYNVSAQSFLQLTYLIAAALSLVYLLYKVNIPSQH